MSAISDHLIHFLARRTKDSPSKQFETFRQIIESGLRTSRLQIKFPSGAAANTQVVCFTDLPLSECTEHAAVYGKFGIGFRKSYAKRVGGNPARYFLDYMPGQVDGPTQVESRGALLYNLDLQYKFMERLREYTAANPGVGLHDSTGAQVFSADDLRSQQAVMLFLFCFDKEMGDLGSARDDARDIDAFYKEREWRLIPSRLNEVSGSAAKSSEGAEHWFYHFERDDVTVVVVPNEEIRHAVLNYFLSLRDHDEPRLQSFGTDPPPIVNFDDLHRW